MLFEDLKAFLLVAEKGSFLSAAVALGISRTTLRRRVEALEVEAGVALFQRGRSGIELTEAGRQLVTHGKVMEQQFSTMLHAIRERGRRPEGEVRVLLPIGLPPAMFAAIYSLFRSSWPAVLIRTRFHEDPLTANLGEVDVLVWFGEGAPRGAWEVHTVLEIRHRLLANRSYLEERGTPRSLEELDAHDLLAWVPPGQPLPKLRLASGATRPIRPVLTSTNIHELHECAQLGLGIACVPDGDLPPGPGQEPLVPLLDDDVGGRLSLRLAVPRALAQVPKVRIFIGALAAMRSVASGEPPPPLDG